MKKNYREIIRYLIVGVLTTVVSLAVYYGLRIDIFKSAECITITGR